MTRSMREQRLLAVVDVSRRRLIMAASESLSRNPRIVTDRCWDGECCPKGELAWG